MRLKFDVYSYLRIRHLQIYVNDQLVDEVEAGGWQAVVTKPFEVHAGLNAIDLRVVEGCDAPSEVSGDADGRCLSVAVQRVELAP